MPHDGRWHRYAIVLLYRSTQARSPYFPELATGLVIKAARIACYSFLNSKGWISLIQFSIRASKLRLVSQAVFSMLQDLASHILAHTRSRILGFGIYSH